MACRIRRSDEKRIFDSSGESAYDVVAPRRRAQVVVV